MRSVPSISVSQQKEATVTAENTASFENIGTISKIDTEMATISKIEPAPTTADPRVDQALGIFADLSTLEVTPTSQVAAREILSFIAVRKPKNSEFVRVSEHGLTTIVYEDRDEGETYFVIPEMRPHMIAGTATKMLVLAVNQANTAFIWPVPVSDELSRKNQWNESQRAAYHQAKTQWVKMVGDRKDGHYKIYIAEGELPAPRFPDKPFPELLALAFNNRKIDSVAHPIIKAMRGLTV
jgi:hypothetical protein